MSSQTDKPEDADEPKYFGKLESFDFSFTKDCEEKLDVMPMDVDKSVEKDADSSVEIIDGDNKIRKRRRVKKDEQDQENPRKILKGSDDLDKDKPGKFKTFRMLMIFLLPVLAYLGLAHNNDLNLQDNFKVLSHKLFQQREHCDKTLDLKPIIGVLKENLYGQNEVIEKLAKDLYTKNFKVALFAGVTGVGKTYAIELIESTFLWPRNIHNIAHPLSDSDLLVLKLTLSQCGYNLIVLDGLGTKTPDGLYKTIRNIQQYSYENKIKVIVILVYNTQKLTKDLKAVNKVVFSKDIIDGFRNEFKTALDVSLVEFNKLSRSDVIGCVLKEASKIHLSITRDEAVKIANEIPDIYGCKGARAKLMLLKPKQEV